MSDSNETTLINDAITADDAGFSSDAGQNIQSEVEVQPESQAEPETQEQLEAAVEEAIEDGASEEEIKQMIKTFKVKVNGKEKEIDLDLSDENQIRRYLQLALAGQSSMQEKKELEKLYGNEIERLKNDPFSVLEELGLDPDELAEHRLRAKVEELKKSPEQLEKERIQKELEDARRKLKEKEQREQELEFQKLQNEAEREIEEDILESLDAHETLPINHKTIQRVAETMHWAMEQGYQDVKAADVLPIVEEEMRREFDAILDNLPEEAFEKFFNKRHLERLRKKRIKKMKDKPKPVNPLNDIKPVGKIQEQKKPKEKKKYRDYFSELGKNYK